MSESKDLKAGMELSDEELMQMTGGSSYRVSSQKNYAPIFSKEYTVKYGVIPVEPPLVLKYGIPITVKYGIPPRTYYGIQPLYGIKPGEF